LTILEERVFENCDKLTSVKLPNGLNAINENALANTAISSITLPSELKEIGDGAFENTKLTSITIPASVSTINGNPFYRLDLEKIIFEEPFGWELDSKTVNFSNSEKNVEIFEDGYSWYIYLREEN